MMVRQEDKNAHGELSVSNYSMAFNLINGKEKIKFNVPMVDFNISMSSDMGHTSAYLCVKLPLNDVENKLPKNFEISKLLDYDLQARTNVYSGKFTISQLDVSQEMDGVSKIGSFTMLQYPSTRYLEITGSIQ